MFIYHNCMSFFLAWHTLVRLIFNQQKKKGRTDRSSNDAAPVAAGIDANQGQQPLEEEEEEDDDDYYPAAIESSDYSTSIASSVRYQKSHPNLFVACFGVIVLFVCLNSD
jgi:hypothetical protein